ncbi:transglutaminase domain-containing protein [Flavobacterium sp. KACC 22763]|uniref:transglutaminase domain-containing protein n=1 Tax=Flavobacterium sp. KACC 22763 TaxID=3025668 RepID=UPI0023657D53|nr:transglutaminase domain-containing protein [Flavobacterium sp. KACC 22763]WDF64077.1 transglutaminase domain-containing protein [Flavobacterium sp. KACC 22763]
MKKYIVSIIAFYSVVSAGQVKNKYEVVDNKIKDIPASFNNSTEDIANYIKSNFESDDDKIRAVYYWTASNISYDVENMFAVNFNESGRDKIEKVLKTRKGVCIHYAEVFNEIANKVGIKSVVIEGFTKQKGFVDYISHAWCGAKINNKWCIFDPTWGSGVIVAGKYSKKINDYYFKADPSKIITTHMPFDYMWQFLNYPITNQEFYVGNFVVNKSKTLFDFDTEIEKYNSLSYIDQLTNSADRIEKNGVKNAMIFDRLSFKRNEAEVQKFNEIVNLYNNGINEFNLFVTFRNNQFKPNVSDEELKKMIDSPKAKLVKCKELLDNLGTVSQNNQANVNSLKTGVNNTLTQVEEHVLFVDKYLGKSKIMRKTMFSKVTFFGAPIN